MAQSLYGLLEYVQNVLLTGMTGWCLFLTGWRWRAERQELLGFLLAELVVGLQLFHSSYGSRRKTSQLSAAASSAAYCHTWDCAWDPSSGRAGVGHTAQLRGLDTLLQCELLQEPLLASRKPNYFLLMIPIISICLKQMNCVKRLGVVLKSCFVMQRRELTVKSPYPGIWCYLDFIANG